MISHGFVSGALFLCVGVLYDRMHSRQIADYGGVVNTMPVFAALFMLFAMANAGLPGTSGFVGEFLVIMGAIKANFWYAFAAATTLVFGAAYTLWMYKRVIFGAVANEHVAALKDLNCARVPGAGRCSRWRCSGWASTRAVRRGAARRRWTSCSRHVAQAQAMNVSPQLINHLPALPEIFLLAGACVRDPDRRPLLEGREAHRHLLARAGVLLACLLATAFVLWAAQASGATLFSGMFVDDLMSARAEAPRSTSRVMVALVYSRPYLLAAACSAASSSRCCCSRRSA